MRWIPPGTVVDLHLEPLEPVVIEFIIHPGEQYSVDARSFPSQQAARLPEHEARDHEIPPEYPHTKIPTGGFYRTACDEDVDPQ